MSWTDLLNGDPLPWLLEEGDPAVRHLALRDLVGCDAEDPILKDARQKAHRSGPITEILAHMHDDGYWAKPGSGYNPKYRSTVWSLIYLGQLGASAEADARIPRTCAYLLDNALTENGQFTMSGAPSGTIDCLQGNLYSTLMKLGYEDPRLNAALDWMTRTVTGDGIAPASDRNATRRYYAGKCGPSFCCGANNKLPCAWGAVKVMSAFAKVPARFRSPEIQSAIDVGVDFLLGVNPAEASYPTGYAEKPSGNWWKFGFPVFYVSDILQIAEVLVELGYGGDPRLADAIQLIRDKQDEQGRWLMEYDYAGKTWADAGRKKEPNKWVTLRALRVLKQVS
jgi:hypothetical protein